MSVERPKKPKRTTDHGGSTMYNVHRCRCEKCVEWNRAYRRRQMRLRWRSIKAGLIERPDGIPHGTLSSYQWWGCRCGDCYKVHREQHKKDNSAYYARKKKQSVTVAGGVPQ